MLALMVVSGVSSQKIRNGKCTSSIESDMNTNTGGKKRHRKF